VRLVAVIGDDFPKEHIQFLKSKNVDTRGLEVQKGETFRWKGEYGYDLNEARTLATDLNVLAAFKPHILDDYKDSEVVFLANVDPEIQLDVLHQVKKPKAGGLRHHELLDIEQTGCAQTDAEGS